MATFSITIPDAQAPRIVADVAKIRGVDISSMNLAQKVAFLKSDLQSYWQDCMIQAEVAAVGETARATAVATRQADILANLTVT